jgi:hypothetical protein
LESEPRKMARQKSWILRMPLIVESLEASQVAHFKRSEVEKLFQIKPTAAAQLMSVAGATKPGGPGTEAVVSRDNLLFYLRNSPDAQDAMAELARRKKLAQTLRESAEEAKWRTVRLPCTKADEWATFEDLPNVSVEPGMLTVAFTSPEDLCAQLFRFAKAIGADWDAFVRMCEPAAQAETPVVDAELSQVEMPGDAGAAVSGESADAAGGAQP